MFKKLNSLRSGAASAADIEAALAQYDIAALEASLTAAQERRADLLLTGDDAEILAAEDEATKARLAIDRAHAAFAELNKRLTEARAREARAAAQKLHDEADAAVTKAVARIKSDYVKHARAIAKLAEEAIAADEAAHSFNVKFYLAGNYADMGEVKSVSYGIGWDNKFTATPTFNGLITLPAFDNFEGFGARWRVLP